MGKKVTPINLAARIQKLPGITFGFLKTGISWEPTDNDGFFENQMITKNVEIRGISEEELVCIMKGEFNAMDPDDKAKYQSV
jgi:hypothetical protein